MDDQAPSPEAVDGPFDGLWVVGSQPGHGTSTDRTWAVLAHLSIFVLALAFPLVLALSKGERSAYVGHQAVEALNFQTTVLLALLLCTLTAAATVGLVLLPVVLVAALVLALRAAASARRGAWHRYPLTLRFVS